jgi:imidazolonepropionase-like amidohydrolase
VASLLVSADRLIDGRGGEPVPDAGVLVSDGLISWVGPVASAPTADERIALSGTVLPGFIDTHVHFALPGGGLDIGTMLVEPPPVRVLKIAAAMGATLRAGVTTVRDLGFLGPSLAALASATPAPRLRNAIAMLSSTGGHGDFPLPPGLDPSGLLALLDMRSAVADGPDALAAATRTLMRDGADVIKVAATGGISTPADGPDDEGFTPAELRTIVEVAAARGRTVAAHAIGAAGIATALDAGVHSIEHGFGLTPDLAAQMAEQGTFLVPTLSVMAKAEEIGLSEKAARWQEKLADAVRLAQAAGVRIATGTDAGLGINHGENLGELAHLVSRGLTPMAAIVAGTSTAAAVCDLADEVGTLEPGKRADLVVAAGNPLDDVSALGDPDTIVLVVRNGNVVKRGAGER